ncbi:MAG: hypothetical protein U5L75_03165 [Candidatus Campbellbacteria bacterium]|nr:hypothetical protein [Candidatus Campbellbacteria bacterium]
MDDPKQILTEKFKKMPEDIQEIAISDEFQSFIQSIVEKEGFSDEQSGALQAETIMVLFGMTDIKEFAYNLESELGINLEKANDITAKIDQNVFSKVRSSFNEVQGLSSPKSQSSGDKKLDQEDDSSEEKVGGSSQEKTEERPTGDPVAGSILGEKRGPGSKHDPYREPIEE